jgi:hypothetical protein
VVGKMLAVCEQCKREGKEFKVPWDRIGAALMQQHLKEHDNENLNERL